MEVVHKFYGRKTVIILPSQTVNSGMHWTVISKKVQPKHDNKNATFSKTVKYPTPVLNLFPIKIVFHRSILL
jgi:hypothetical protein